MIRFYGDEKEELMKRNKLVGVVVEIRDDDVLRM